jgi:hypothetical protein
MSPPPSITKCLEFHEQPAFIRLLVSSLLSFSLHFSFFHVIINLTYGILQPAYIILLYLLLGHSQW